MNQEFKIRLDKIETELNSILPKNIDKIWQQIYFPQFCENSTNYIKPSDFSALVKPTAELMNRGGKRWRPLLSVLSCEMAGGDTKNIYPLTPLIELCHTASLIHDDIEDNSETRRGGRAIHLEYGTDIAINCASWLYFHAMQVIELYDSDIETKNQLYKLYSTNLLNLHLGQAMDISWHSQKNYIPNKDEYINMISLKTGSLSKLAGELGFVAAKKNHIETSEYGTLMQNVGIAFQILDDVKNITQGNAGKKRGDDIVENKKSLPVIFCAEENKENLNELITLFNQASTEGIESDAVEKSISIIANSGSIEKSKVFAKNILDSSIDKLEKKYKENKSAHLIAELFSSLMCGRK